MTTVPKCRLCSGSAGALDETGAHGLCTARAARGLATPSLGDRCPRCNGTKRTGRGGAMLSFDMGPARIARSIDAQFPPCRTCDGTGRVNAAAGAR